MPTDKINGAKIYWELAGDMGEPLVLVHGSWGDHHNWDQVVKELSKTFRVLTYDRRGHSQSERLPGQGFAEEDVDDLVGLTEHLDLSPAHIVGSSFGAAIVLKAASKRPDLFKSLMAHEPPLLDLLKNNPNAQDDLKVMNGKIKQVVDLIAGGDIEKAAQEFVEKIALGPGVWKILPGVVQQTFINNAITWFDEMHDPQSLQMNLSTFSNFKHPALFSSGSESSPFFPMVIDELMNALPHAKRMIIERAGHVPHMSHPAQFIEMVRSFCLGASRN